LLHDPARLEAMSRAAAGVMPLDADEKLADLVETAAREGVR
jgi:UDP-N-acetylglucosamine--N-acetylmuramyl-(pentapeptide) pyrophosphoryl-undecaprenol N-acetylglucosamine transferase